MQEKKFLLGILLAIFCVPLSLFVGTLPPPCPPPDMQKGYAMITFRDPFQNTPIEDVPLYIYFVNGTHYLNTTSGTTFYVPEACYFYAVKEGYWEVSGPVWANGQEQVISQSVSLANIFPYPCPTPSEPELTEVAMVKRCPRECVRINITAIDGVEGNYSSNEIPDGYHNLTLTYLIAGEYYNTSAWGCYAYLPPVLIPNGSYAEKYRIPWRSLWIAWEGGISDYYISYGNSQLWHYDTYPLETLNSTPLSPLALSGSLLIKAYFYNISTVYLYYGLVDDTTYSMIPL